MGSNNRILYLDTIRIMACVMIVAMHAPIPNTGLGSVVLSSDSLLTAPGIGLFVMVSGALLLPVRLSTKDFLRRRLGKVVGPTVVWTLIYWAVAPWTEIVHRGNGMRSFLSIPFSAQFNGVLWFMYMLVGLYLLAPILSAWLQRASRKEVEFYLVVWAITMCYPLMRSYIEINEGYTGALHYFGGYSGYFLLGYYLNSYVVRASWLFFMLLLFVPWAVAAYMKIMGGFANFYDLFWYLSILTAMTSMAWFLIIRRLIPDFDASSALHRTVVLISNYCFGVYLSHILVMRGLLWHWEALRQLEGIIQIAATTLLTLTGSLLLTWFVSWLPGAGYIVGFRRRRNK